jgi:uncharacterized membrane protein
MTAAIEEHIGWVLRIGSVLSTALLAVGVVVLLSTSGAAVGLTLIHAGLLIVLATPVVRVFVAMIGFMQQQEWAFVLMTLAVLLVLAASVVAAFS